MKILSIRGENIASLEKFEVNFQEEPLKSSGIFAILGQTGAGKSSLLDTMCLALFNRVPRLDDAGTQGLKFESKFGEVGQGDIKHMIRRGTSTCSAEVEFLGIDGNAYRARWGYRLPNRAGASPQEEHSLIRISDQLVIVNNAKTSYLKEIEGLIGLKYDQFTRTVFLSQGKFAEFLKSDENTRSELLEKITGTGIYATISKNVFEKNRNESKILEDLKLQVSFLQLLSPEKIMELTSEVGLFQDRINQQVIIRDNMKMLSTAINKWKKACEDLEVIKGKLEKNKQDEAREKTACEILESDLSLSEKKYIELEPILLIVSNLDIELNVLKQREIDADKVSKSSLRSRDDLVSQHAISLSKSAEENNKIKTLEDWFQLNLKYKSLSVEWTRWQKVFKDCASSLNSQKKAKGECDLSQLKLKEIVQAVSTQKLKIETLKLSLGDVDRSELPKRLTGFSDELKEINICLNYFRIYNDYIKALAKKEACKTSKSNSDLLLGPAEKAYIVASQVYDAAVKATGENIEALRAELKEGESCSVCGSLEHPYAGASHKLNSFLKDQKNIREQSQKDYNEALANTKSALSQLTDVELKVDLSEKELKSIAEPVSELYLKLRSLSQSDQTQLLNDKSNKIKDEMDVLNSKYELSQNLQKIETEYLSLQSDERSIAEKNKMNENNFNLEISRFEDFASQLDVVYEGQDWRMKWLKGPDLFENEQEAIVYEYNKNVEKMQIAKDLLVKSEEQKKTISLNLPLAIQKMEDDEKLLNEIKKLKDSKTIERTNIFGTDLVAEVRENNEKLIKSKRILKDTAKEALQKSINASSVLAGGKSVKTDEIEVLLSEILSTISTLAKDNSGEFQYDWQYVDSANYFELKNLIDLKCPELERKIQKNTDDKASCSAQLKQNQEAQINAEKIQNLILIQKPIQEKWSKLNSEIGSSDGKVFRKIAQVFTLEVLLTYANLQLSQITSRYKLEQTGDSGHFGIIDQDNYGEMRPVHTLSGGETFIVSLALALGLSSMASNGLTIESLFIDEGFGTLDSDTLKCVMNALSQLQAQGRKIGLITHVEEMKEQIPTRVEVIKEGMGTSSVRVVG